MLKGVQSFYDSWNVSRRRCFAWINRATLSSRAVGTGGRGLPPTPYFGSSVNPISTGRADYAHLINTPPPRFSDFPTALSNEEELSWEDAIWPWILSRDWERKLVNREPIWNSFVVLFFFKRGIHKTWVPLIFLLNAQCSWLMQCGSLRGTCIDNAYFQFSQWCDANIRIEKWWHVSLCNRPIYIGNCF